MWEVSGASKDVLLAWATESKSGTAGINSVCNSLLCRKTGGSEGFSGFLKTRPKHEQSAFGFIVFFQKDKRFAVCIILYSYNIII